MMLRTFSCGHWPFAYLLWKCFLLMILCPLLFIVFKTAPVAYGSSQARGRIRAVSCWPMPQPQPHRIRAASATYNSAHRDQVLTPAEPQQELLVQTAYESDMLLIVAFSDQDLIVLLNKVMVFLCILFANFSSFP